MTGTGATRSFVPDRATVMRLLQAAILAPSADNQHHVLFAIEDGGVVLRTDDFFVQCRVAHRRLLTLLSYGAVVENLRLRLTEEGFTFRPEWFPDRSDPSVLLHLRWDRLTAVALPDPLARQVEGRHTNRRFSKGPPLTRAESATLAAAVPESSWVALEWFDRPDRRRALLRIMRTAETARFGSRALHAELFESIDFTAGWDASTPVRLAPGALEVERALRLPFAAFRDWRRMRAGNWFGAQHAFGFRAGDLPARLSPHLGVLTSTLPPEAAALAVGAAFQRVWLAAEAHGLALQPMVASAILATSQDPDNALPAATWQWLHARWRPLVGDALPLVVFRLGRAPRPRIRSGRRPIEDHLI